MKKLGNLIKSKLPKTTTCGTHMEALLPNLRPLEYCNTCSISLCYACGNKHIDSYCNVEWGSDIFDCLELTKSDKNEKFNTGHPFLIDLQKLKCPCGAPFLSKNTSSICSACGTATCSPECHDNHAQRDNKCLFINNFIPNEETSLIQGLRLIKISDIIKAIKLEIPVYSPTSVSNTKFLKSLLGPSPFTIILQRGFRQYGQPHDASLECMEEFQDPMAENLFDTHYSRLCMCECANCSNRSPHPVYNCYQICETNEKLSEKEKLQYGMYKKCRCTCSFCLSCDRSHLLDDCIKGCLGFSNKRL